MKRLRILLFDMDGVLITPGGYRAAFIATMNYFGQKLGFEGLAPSVSEIEVFEAESITNEWDMIGLSMAAVVQHVAANLPVQFSDLQALIDRVPVSRLPTFRPDYVGIARRTGSQWRRGEEKPSHTGLRWYLANSAPSAHDVLHELLADNFEVAKTPTTRIFQHFTLGSDGFVQTYRMDAELESSSLLAKHDRTALRSDLRDLVLRASQNGTVRAAVYTARPSLPPAGHDRFGYAPEAEPGMAVAGLTSLPLIGTGRVNWLAFQVCRAEGSFIKPSPVQALAAAGAALGGNEEAALWAALDLAEGVLPSFWRRYQGTHLELHVFEDATGGIQAVQRAGEILREAGIEATVVGHGIAVAVDKVRTLQQVADAVYPDINAALETLQLG